ncbi:alpha/beta fold hydrolase [Aestuariispira insulae]|uniref:Alpha-beta hydrolase superfamily lysophospholipase n=1 Tax=Aestuariispira insulae TaxID=1461337 RepID=A0A3D9HJZ3_9PROT|nr:alpha/beta hydrolase [Aestuariispira insulae]RED49745.1 alpha-beta hydrolase superfamily lysophospholipase [Aestuariispira insulae]
MELTIQGTKIFANTGGQAFDAAKPVIILVHGAGMSHAVWGQQTRFLAHHGFSVLAIDLPGHGRSEGEAIASIEGLGDFIAELIQESGAEKAVICGHSMGALACLQTASSHGDKVAGLILCGMAASMPVHPDLLAAAEANDIRAAKLVASWGHGGPAHKGGNIAHGVWMIGAAIRLIDQSKPGVLFADMAACNAYQGAIAAAGQVSCPVLMIQGTLDKMAPPKAAQPLLEAFEHCDRAIIEGSGHMMMAEAPDATREAIFDFVGEMSQQG